MEAFVTRKKRKASPTPEPPSSSDEPTDVKLAMLSSLNPSIDQETLLDILLAHDGNVSEASAALQNQTPAKRSSGVIGHQSSLRHFATEVSSADGKSSSPKKPKLLSKKGKTVFLYDPADIAEHTPCSIIHNFLPPELANDLLKELLEESKTYEKITFKLFENVVSSPHTSSFYLGSLDLSEKHKMEYLYNGARLTDIRPITPQLDKVKPLVQAAVNHEIQTRTATHHGGRKLQHQSPKPWAPNAAFVNHYAGPHESVGWHSDQLTYLGPRAVIGSLSLGVAREFRVRRILPRDDAAADEDAEGQLAIHLPHNSLLVMHAEMQEGWKHSVSAAAAVDPHPLAGSARINVTYRDYRPEFHPRFTPRCRCGVPTVLRVVQRKRENYGRYFWMCQYHNVPEKEGCSFFQWAAFDDDGNPIWETNGGRGAETGGEASVLEMGSLKGDEVPPVGKGVVEKKPG